MSKVAALAVRRLRPQPSPTPVPASWAADFRLAIDPAHIVQHRAWQVARACALATIEAGSGLVVVLGAPGTGKSLLLNDLTCGLLAAGADVQLVNRGDMAQVPAGHGVVLIDEADRMDAAVLGKIVAATDTCHVIAALPRFAERLAGFGKPMTVLVLAPLTTAEMRLFLAQRLACTGLPADLLSDAAQAASVEHAGGIPRVVNMLVGSAIALAAAEGAKQVTAEHVAQVVGFRDGLELRAISNETAAASATPAETMAAPATPAPTSAPPPRRMLRRGAVAVAALALWAILLAALTVYRSFDREPAVQAALVTGPAQEPQISVAEAPAMAETHEMAELVTVEPVADAEATVAPAPLVPAPEPATIAEAVPPQPVKDPPRVERVAIVLPPAIPATRIRIQYPRGDGEAEVRANRQVDALRANGFRVEAPAPVAGGAARPGIRYFFVEDRDAAAEVARRLEDFAGDIRLAAPARRDALPRPGTIEVLLPAR